MFDPTELDVIEDDAAALGDAVVLGGEAVLVVDAMEIAVVLVVEVLCAGFG